MEAARLGWVEGRGEGEAHQMIINAETSQSYRPQSLNQVSNGWLNLVRLYSLYKILYPKRRIESYSWVP